jgi:hypothetical protein
MEHSMARQLAPLILSDEERAKLRRLASRRKTAQALALRARIVLACAEGSQNKEVAAKLGVVEMTVGKWRRRFIQDRLEGLRDARSPPDDRLALLRASEHLKGAHDVALLHDQKVLAVDFEFRARPFAEQHAVADLQWERRASNSLTEFIFSHNTLEILGFAFDAVSNASVRLNREARNNSVDGPFAIVGAALRSLALMMNVVVEAGHSIPSAVL